MLIAVLISLALTLALLGFLLLVVIGIFALAVTLIGAINARGGEAYRYPLSLRCLK